MQSGRVRIFLPVAGVLTPLAMSAPAPATREPPIECTCRRYPHPAAALIPAPRSPRSGPRGGAARVVEGGREAAALPAVA